ncbi:tannase/feruloyl esterase family alpha/beta hydrolase [Variovorax paradoxus]|nr:tannase/feruloyl esterase family alpha/beta hydrolase [Variovorax paradoxus]
MTPRLSPLAALLPFLAVAVTAGCGGGGSGNYAALPAAATPTPAAPTPTPATPTPPTPPVAMNCAAVTSQSLALPGLVVESAASMPAKGPSGSAASYPAHCKVTGSINKRVGIDGKSYAIGFDVRLPDAGWNGKFFYSGDAGLDGAIGDPLGTVAMGGKTNALTLGYAVVSSDGGHIGTSSIFDGSFGFDPQARVDYGYNALGTLTPLAKKIVTQYFGTAPVRSYYAGCSKGGQSGMQAAARYADQFDGIIAGDPGFNLPKAAVENMFENQQLATVNADLTKAFSAADLGLVSSSILAKCDALDGAADGMVNDLARCKTTFNPDTDVPQCAAGGTPDGSCLSATQKTALKAIMGGAKASNGDPLYADWPWDPGVTGSGWTSWKTFLNSSLGPVAMSSVFSVPPTPGVLAFRPTATTYWQTFDLNQSFNLIYGRRPQV